MTKTSTASLLSVCAAIALMAGCSPTVKVEAPDKPIEINMNIKIDQEVRVKVDKDLDSAFAQDPELFGNSAAAAPAATPAQPPQGK